MRSDKLEGSCNFSERSSENPVRGWLIRGMCNIEFLDYDGGVSQQFLRNLCKEQDRARNVLGSGIG